MNLPMHRRKFRAYISLADNDAIAEQTARWLIDQAGISVWLDDQESRSDLDDVLGLCRSMIIPLTSGGIKSGWVQSQVEAGMKRRQQDGNSFRLILIRTADCPIPEFIQSLKWLDLSHGLTMDSAVQIISNLYASGWGFRHENFQDIYLIRSWNADGGVGDLIAANAKKLGLRLVMNPEDGRKIPPSFGGGIVLASAAISQKALQKVLDEVKSLRDSNLPYIVVCDQGANLSDWVREHALVTITTDMYKNFDAAFAEEIFSALLNLQSEWIAPLIKPYIFYGTDLKDDHKQRNHLVRQVVQEVAVMPCLMGEDIQHGQVQQEIVSRIIHAEAVIADISMENLNTCIEAGIALGANVPVHLVSGDERHKPPFMFRDRQIWHYHDDLALLALAHKLSLPYRKEIFP